MKKEMPIALIGIGFVGVVALIELYQIKLMAQIIDVGIAFKDFEVIKTVGLKMVGLALLGATIGMLGLYFPSQASNNFALNLRKDIFKKIQSFSLKNMTNFQTSSLVTRLTNDVNFLQRTMMMMLRMAVRAPVLLVSTVILTYIVSPELSTVMIVAVLILSAVLLYIIKLGFPRFVLLQKKVDKMNRKVQESLSNIRVIKSFVREKEEDASFADVNHELYDASVSANILMVMMNPFLMTAINFATIVVVYLGTFLIVDAKSIQVGDLIVFISYLRFTMFSMLMITFVLMMISRSKASLVRIEAVLNTDADISSTSGLIPEKSEGKIEYKNVSFKYFEDSNPILSKVNLEILPGQQIGIIGSTGSGKTSLINLLVRLIDVSEGEILYDGVNIKELDLKYLRSQFGFVPQKNVLFSGTVEENLRLGDESASYDKLVRATKAANIFDFIDNSDDGFKTVIQQGGSNLSGGQRQRMCIARALIVEPKVLVMDDSTSALDSATEKKVMESLLDMYGHLTLINVAQKISSVSSMDKIIVLDEGEIVGFGKHDELLNTCDVYQEIYESQMRKGDLE